MRRSRIVFAASGAAALALMTQSARANNTYTWVGFFEEDASQPSTNPATAGTGRLVMSVVASKDGTTIYSGTLSSPATELDPIKLLQVGKLNLMAV